MLDQIRQSLTQFTPTERRIAEAVLETPGTAITWSVADAARIAGVSEPSVIRFCRRLGCDGFPDFRLKLAERVINRPSTQISAENDDGSTSSKIDKIFARSLEMIHEARIDIDPDGIERATELLAIARKIDVYGYGSSGFLAGDVQYRLTTLGKCSSAYSDPTLQMVSAAHLIPIVTEPDSRDSQKPTNLNRWRKQEVCDGFGDFVAIRL